MVNYSHQVFRRICPCTGCGVRTQCVSKDGGFNFYCNRCGVAYGAFRGHMYDDPKQSEIPKANADMYSGQEIKPEIPKTTDSAMKEMNDLIAQGLNPKQARGKVFGQKSVIVEEDEKPRRKARQRETST